MWRSEGSTAPSELQQLVGYWRVWHATKIAISGLTVTVLTMLAVELWRCYLSITRQSSLLAGTAGVATFLIAVAGLILAVNIQATAAPLIALLPLLAQAPRTADFTSTHDAIKISLTDGANPALLSPPLRTLIQQVQTYHWVLAGTAVLMAGTAFGLAVVSWRRRRLRTGTPAERVRGASGAIASVAALASIIYLVVATYSLVCALTPASALRDTLG